MSITKKIIILTTILAIGCFVFAFYLAKYRKDPFAEVSFSSSRCFHYSAYKLRLINEGDVTIARLDSGNTRINETFISDKQLETFYLFVNEIPRVSEGSCTSVDQYVKESL